MFDLWYECDLARGKPFTRNLNIQTIQEHRGLLSVRYPMEHGIVRDWNDMERIWQYVYSKDQLQTFSEEHPVLLTEAPLNPSKNRERAAEVFFETFNVPALFISMQAVLSLYATGRTTGVVLDAGDGVTHAVPIYEGFAMPHSIMRVDIAGRDVSRYLRLLLRKEGYDFHTSAEFEVVRTIKEIGPSRFRAPELLFRPDLIGDESEGIHEVLAFSIQKSDLDLRRTLFSNIVLSGGSTLFKGFGDRLLSEVKKLAPKDVKIKGSGVVKAGFAGDQIPKYCFPNYVGRPKHVRVMAGALEGDLFIGPKAESLKPFSSGGMGSILPVQGVISQE
ncbi:Beta-centractin [Acipenser ruthenus]|uniref:Beta-centractin n=1 Tax=Acipenser ruthenus TaxID=7906 RepID=A0A444V154_ACIRT|nr:Beta-centractin [Acipenser ruthenus]